MPLRRKTLADLPSEIVSQIASHAPSASFLRSLSLTSRSLHEIVEADGWNAFVTNRFPSIPVPPYWRDAAHALTTLSRNFDRRAFIAQDLGPDLGRKHTLLHELPSGELCTQWKRPQGQTMGYQPVIDSREVWTGNSWDSRREIVAWGAGAEVVIQIMQRGAGNPPDDLEPSLEDRNYNRLFDKTGNSRRLWLTHRRPTDLEGRDDITSINLVDTSGHQSLLTDSPHSERTVDVIVGRASGGLEMLQLRTAHSACVKTFDSGNLPVRAADVSSATQPLVAACVGDTKLALYSVHGDEEHAVPASEVMCASDSDRASRSWSARFLSHDKLAVGRGISSQIVYVYSVRPDGLSEDPIRSFGSSRGDDRQVQTSAYPIAPVSASSTTHEPAGDMFFSGGHDGVIRLHDMRSARDCETMIADPSDGSAIFSLATVGRERLIAGAAVHSLVKVFDLRMTGGRRYFYQTAGEAVSVHSSAFPAKHELEMDCLGWNTFTRISNPNGMRRRRLESPVYSLSRPSPSSTSLYIGMENTVCHFNFTSMSDQHPDPVFRSSIIRTSNGRVDSRKTWNPIGRVVPLNMYERMGHAEGRLMTQKYGGYTPRLTAGKTGQNGDASSKLNDRLVGYDDRWHYV